MDDNLVCLNCGSENLRQYFDADNSMYTKRFIEIMQELAILNPPDENDENEHWDILFEALQRIRFA